MRVGQPVASEEPDDSIADVYQGHPGRLIDVMAWMNEVIVSFVNGPSLCLPPSAITPISEQDYLERGQRLVWLLHPLADRAVPGFSMPGSEWPEGHEPVLQTPPHGDRD